jgi:hypothetical protein
LDGVTSAIQTQINGKQATLVSGTNIKTVNSTSLLGSGDIAISANPSGVAGAIQFSNGSAFASDASNFFWDDTNKRLGIGTNAPTTALQINYSSSTLNGLLINQTGGVGNFSNIGFANGGTIRSTFGMNLNTGEVRWFNASGGYFATIYGGGSEAMRIDASRNVGIGTASASARTHIVGSGSTSATTSLLVQNSAGSTALSIRDDLSVTSFGELFLTNNLNNSARINGNNSALRMFAFGSAGVAKQSMAIYNDVVQFLSTTQLAFSSNTTDPVTTLDVGMARYGAGVMRITNGSTGVGNLFLGGTTGYDASAKLQIDSTTQGVLFPRMTTTQKNAITAVAGLVLYDSTTNKLQCYNGSTWNDLF